MASVHIKSCQVERERIIDVQEYKYKGIMIFDKCSQSASSRHGEMNTEIKTNLSHQNLFNSEI